MWLTRNPGGSQLEKREHRNIARQAPVCVHQILAYLICEDCRCVFDFALDAKIWSWLDPSERSTHAWTQKFLVAVTTAS